VAATTLCDCIWQTTIGSGDTVKVTYGTRRSVALWRVFYKVL